MTTCIFGNVAWQSQYPFRNSDQLGDSWGKVELSLFFTGGLNGINIRKCRERPANVRKGQVCRLELI